MSLIFLSHARLTSTVLYWLTSSTWRVEWWVNSLQALLFTILVVPEKRTNLFESLF